MSGNDVVTRDDLGEHCEARHKPVMDALTDIKYAHSRLDGRIWALVIAVLFSVVGMLANIIIGISTRSTISHGFHAEQTYEAGAVARNAKP